MDDPILTQMAVELRAALIAAGCDPKHPPADSSPPADRAWAEYQRRGGDIFKDPDLFMKTLVAQVGKP